MGERDPRVEPRVGDRLSCMAGTPPIEIRLIVVGVSEAGVRFRIEVWDRGGETTVSLAHWRKTTADKTEVIHVAGEEASCAR